LCTQLVLDLLDQGSIDDPTPTARSFSASGRRRHCCRCKLARRAPVRVEPGVRGGFLGLYGCWRRSCRRFTAAIARPTITRTRLVSFPVSPSVPRSRPTRAAAPRQSSGRSAVRLRVRMRAVRIGECALIRSESLGVPIRRHAGILTACRVLLSTHLSRRP